MANRTALLMTGQWKSFIRALDGGDFRKRLDSQLKVAHNRMGREFVKTARRAISAGNYAPNSPITVILKGSSKPLVADSDLFNSITYQADGKNVRLGLIRSKSGAKQVNIGATLHEGATINVGANPAIRRAVWARVREKASPAAIAQLNKRQRAVVTKAAVKITARSAKKGRMTDRQRRYFFAKNKGSGSSSGGGKRVWRIPARPFLIEPLNDPTYVSFVRDTWAEAVQIALFPPGQ